ncbi:hypothetical protein [Cohnella sp. 56]|uniref:hypothetical protein n=1 Tax=Cohnella sp. 56 TaxID=3113722 RepID=UPI0030EB0306
MLKPTVNDIVSKLTSVLEGKLTREEVSHWAENWSKFISNESGLSESDLLLWRYMDTISGVDLKDSPLEYLHNEEDIQDWINRINNYSSHISHVNDQK